MKKIIFAFILSLFVLNSNLVFAEEQTVSEDKSKPSITIEFNKMDEFQKEFEKLGENFSDDKIEINYEDRGGLGSILAVGLLLVFFIFAIFFASLIFWILMLIHAISKPIKSKAVWILILLIFGIIGAIIYYFAVKREFRKKEDEVIKAEKV